MLEAVEDEARAHLATLQEEIKNDTDAAKSFAEMVTTALFKAIGPAYVERFKNLMKDYQNRNTKDVFRKKV